MRRILVAALLLLALSASAARAADSAVILVYHRFGEDGQPATNISLPAFEAHLKELTGGAYTVLPLIEILAAIYGGRPLPDRAVAITIDDGYRSAFAEAWPRLKAAGLPFTVFVTSGAVDAGTEGIMSWDQLRALADAGVGIGAHSHTHPHMVEASEARVRDELARVNRRLAEELGRPAEIFAYPYGEASARVMALVEEAGYRFALGDHSGVAHRSTNPYFVPRFTLSDVYGDMSRLRLVLNALPLPVADVTPADPLIGAVNPPNPGFTLTGERPRIGSLSCYASSEGRVRVEPLGERRVEVRLAKPLPPGRTRLNCTMPGPEGRWRWHGAAFYVPEPDPGVSAGAGGG